MPEPVTFAEAAAQLQLGDDVSEQTQVEGYIVAAREWVEDYTGLVLTRREVTEKLASLADHTMLRAWPIDADQPVTIAYRDSAGTEQSITSAVLRAGSRPGLIYPAQGTRWPLRETVAGAVTVTFTAGYPDAASVPQVLKQAMLIMLTAFFEDREGGELFAAAERTARGLCRRYKRHIV